MQKIKDFIYYNRKEILIGVLSLLVLINLFNKNNREIIEPSEIVNEEKIVEKKIIVDIKGEVNCPGTYELNENDRIKDVIEKSGGLTKDADTNGINLSEKVTDEMLILIPSKENTQTIEEKTSASSSYKPVSDGKVSINKASIQDLMTIKGIGETKAKAIIDYRNKQGSFKNIDEIKNVSGIGKTTFEKIKDYIKL